MKFAADPPDSHGMLTKFVVVPEDFCYKIPETLGLDEAVLVEPLAVAVHVVRLAEVRPGQNVVVMGAGTVGLLCAAVAKAYGAEIIVVVDILQRRLDFAKDFIGCETFLPTQEDTPRQIAAKMLEQCNVDEGADALLEASGAEPSIQTGMHVLRPGGTYVQAGLGKPDVTVPILAMSEKELKVLGCYRYSSGDFALAVNLLRKGDISVKSLISSISPFEDAPKAWERTKNGEGIKNLIAGVKD